MKKPLSDKREDARSEKTNYPVNRPSSHVMAHHPPRVLQILAEIERDRSFKPRVQLAVAAAKILFGPIVLPIRRRMHFRKGLIVTIGYQIAWPLPSLWIARDRSPGTALQVAFAD